MTARARDTLQGHRGNGDILVKRGFYRVEPSSRVHHVGPKRHPTSPGRGRVPLECSLAVGTFRSMSNAITALRCTTASMNTGQAMKFVTSLDDRGSSLQKAKSWRQLTRNYHWGHLIRQR